MIADYVVNFNKNLAYHGKLPIGYKVMNPFIDNPETFSVMNQFYQKFYNDNHQRKFIIGINPSRHGAGVTGVPFTDTKRLESICGIKMYSAHTHEVSSVFLYDMIQSYGGVKHFYSEFYINSPFPLAILKKSPNGTWLNANYYDDKTLFLMLKDYMVESLKKHIKVGLDCSRVFVLGTKNAQFILKINQEAKLFKHIEVLEHPRYIQQYKSKEKAFFIDKYIATLSGSS